ncbi:MAG: TonB family protein [bacterium]
MFNENNKGIGLYIIYSAIFHIVLIGLIVYLSIRYRPEMESIGSKVVVSVVSRVPGPLASVRSILYPPKPKAAKQAAAKPVPVKTEKSVPMPPVKNTSSMAYPKKVRRKAVPYKRQNTVRPVAPNLNPNAYAHLQNMVSLNNAYSKIQESLIRGNVHRFQGYVNKITSIIMSHFDISLSKYLRYKSIVDIQISASGRIYGVRLAKSSGNGYFDSQSVEAVKLSSPLPPPPKGFVSFMNSMGGLGIIFNPKALLKGR